MTWVKVVVTTGEVASGKKVSVDKKGSLSVMLKLSARRQGQCRQAGRSVSTIEGPKAAAQEVVAARKEDHGSNRAGEHGS